MRLWNAMRKTIVISIVLLLVASACSSDNPDTGPDPSTAPPGAPGTPGQPGIVSIANTGAPLSISLSTGNAQTGEEPEPVAIVTGEPLDDSSVTAIFDRLPEWIQDRTDREDFNRPVDSLRPPLVGETVEGQFPPPVDTDRPDVPTGPLEVLRFQPEGDVDIAPFLSITFNQPMVPLATVEQLDEFDVPVTITPELPGRWQWIGTRTLRFEHDVDVFDRLPMATEYTVTIPAGTTSETGGELAESTSWGFTTPPVEVVGISPNLDERYGPPPPLSLEPIFVVEFDQRVDPAAIIAETSFFAAGNGAEIRLATEAEIAADETAQRAVDRLRDRHWVAFRPVDALRPATSIVIDFEAGLPSAEGPLLSTVAKRYDGATYAALEIDEINCSRRDRCQPGSQLWARFNNNIDLDTFDPAFITVAPAISGMTVFASGNSITIRGATLPNADYVVTYDGAITDEWGQTLGDSVDRTFQIGNADPFLQSLHDDILTLDPLTDRPTFGIASLGHEALQIQAYRVDPSDFPAYLEFRRAYLRDENQPAFPSWPEVLDTEVGIDADENDIVETAIDISEALDGDFGHLVVLIEPTGRFANLDRNDDDYWNNQPSLIWVQSTNIGLDLFSDTDQLVAWTTDLRTGAPLAGTDVSFLTGSTTMTTNADGIGIAPLTSVSTAVATAGEDTAILLGDQQSFTQSDRSIWYVFDDRQMYRPGETASFKGWVRELTLSEDAQLANVPDGAAVTYRVSDPFGNELDTGELDLNRLGGFDFTVDIPEASNLGWANIEFELKGVANSFYGHQFQVQEFRRPEFEVSARNESIGPYLVTEPATVAVQAEYFSGGPLPEADVEWTVRTSDTSYSPPNWNDYTFGVWTPWWYRGFGRGFESDFGDCFDCFPGGDQGEVETFTGLTNGAGEHFLQLDFTGDGEGLPTSVTAAATVFDVNRQAWASSTNLLVHPSQVYVGLRTPATFVKQGEPLDVEAVAVDIDGEIASGRAITIEAARLDWQLVNGEWEEVAIDSESCDVTSDAEPVSCSFATDVGGRYRVTAIVADEAGRTSRTELTRWVTGGNRRPNRNITQEELTLIPNQETYAPGDTAEILVQAPFSPATGLVTTSRNGIVSTESFTIEGDSAVVEVPIVSEHTPNLHVQIDVVGATERVDDRGEGLPDAPDRPAFAVGQLTLSIPPVSRTLTVVTEPADPTTQPGSATSVDVTVTDAAGNPVENAELAVVVVDEAVLALSSYELTDPLDIFYGPIESGLRSAYGRRSIKLTDPERLRQGEDLAVPASAEMTDEMSASPEASADSGGESAGRAADLNFSYNEQAQTAIDVRTNFDALAVFAPEVATAADGTATIEVPLPDSLTRYRVMVVAVDGTDRFGTGESNITARLPLQVRPSAPRFLNFGDSFELPVVIQNQTDEAMTVDVAIQTSNLSLTAGNGQRVTVPANNRIEVRFPAAAEDVGTASFRVAAVSGDNADAATIRLPVYTPATSEAFATYGVVDGTGTTTVGQTIVAPDDVFPQFGGLEVNTSSTALQSLTDAVLYLHEYRYANSDGLAARILAVAALRDVLDAFDADGLPAVAELNQRVQTDIDNLLALQTNNGGFAVWSTIRGSSPYHSAYATHALVEAKANGYNVPDDRLANALAHLADIEQFYPNEYYQADIPVTLSAYALHVRNLAGDRDANKATQLYRNNSIDELHLEGTAWLWPVIDDAGIRAEIERTFANRATETAGAATFASDYGDEGYLILHSSRRTDGVILDALISEAPSSDLIPKVVAGLMAGQTRGRWNNAQENSFILLALNNYFDTFESVDPDFVARVWLGDLYAAEHTYEGRSTDRNITLVPMTDLLDQTGDDRTDLVVSKDGEGRLYYRLGLRYAPISLDLDPLDRGFVVERTYEAVDDPDDVTQGADGTWRIKAGAEVRIRLTMVADARRTHVALIDPMPAGFEALNPALSVTGPIPIDEGIDSPNAVQGRWWSWWRWFEHQNLRDDRAEAFAGILYGGTYDYSYVARATTPGEFVVPPARAEEIYAPETFGRSATERVVIVD